MYGNIFSRLNYFFLPTAVPTLRRTLGGRWSSGRVGWWAATPRAMLGTRGVPPRTGRVNRKPPEEAREAWQRGTDHGHRCPRWFSDIDMWSSTGCSRDRGVQRNGAMHVQETTVECRRPYNLVPWQASAPFNHTSTLSGPCRHRSMKHRTHMAPHIRMGVIDGHGGSSPWHTPAETMQALPLKATLPPM